MARDVAIRFNGAVDTVFDFSRAVEGKAAEEQRYLINLATSVGTDGIYPDKGTELLEQSMGGLIVDYNGASHLGNFASLDTRLFMEDLGPEERIDSDDAIYGVSVSPVSYGQDTRTLHYTVQFTFNDGTETSEDVTIKA